MPANLFIAMALCLAFALPSEGAAQVTDSPPSNSIESARDAFGRAVTAQNEGRYEDALEAIGQAQRLEPENGRFIWRRVLILEAMGEPVLARNVLDGQRDRILEAVEPDEVEAVESRLATRDEARPEPTDDEAVDTPPEPDSVTTPTPALGLVLTGVGATFGSAAVVLFLVAASDEHRLDCSTQLRDDCEGVTLIDELDQQEIDRRTGRIDTLRTAGWIGTGVSIALLGWGIWELVAFDDSASKLVHFAPWFGDRSAGAHIQINIWSRADLLFEGSCLFSEQLKTRGRARTDTTCRPTNHVPVCPKNSMSKRDYYEVLGVSRDADDRTLKKAYRKLAMQYHPDRNPGDNEAEAAFKEAAEAYEVLSNPEMRARYDRFGHEGLRGGGGGGAGFHSVDDIFSQFGDIFGDFFGFGGRRQRRDGPQRGADLRYDMELEFTEAVFGTSKEIEVPRHSTCETCDGSGAKPGSQPKTCGSCGGSGQMHHSQGFFTLTSTCPECRGDGKIIKDKCEDCSGAGVIEETRQVAVKIPAGVDNGTRLRLRAEGEGGRRGGPTGDLYVFLHVKQSDVFTRQDADLHIEAKVSAIHAALGGTIVVPTLGEPRDVTIPAGTQYGDKAVLSNEGVQHVNRQTRGNIVVHFNVQTPTNLSEEQREVLESFADKAGVVLDGARHESLPEMSHESEVSDISEVSEVSEADDVDSTDEPNAESVG